MPHLSVYWSVYEHGLYDWSICTWLLFPYYFNALLFHFHCWVHSPFREMEEFNIYQRRTVHPILRFSTGLILTLVPNSNILTLCTSLYFTSSICNLVWYLLWIPSLLLDLLTAINCLSMISLYLTSWIGIFCFRDWHVLFIPHII